MKKNKLQHVTDRDWEVSGASAKLTERRRLMKVLYSYLKQDEQKLEELISSRS